MSVINRLIERLSARRADPRDALRPLYAAVVERSRTPAWYLDGAPDTLDGRFDMLTALVSMLVLRLDKGAEERAAAAHLTEIFITDMDGQLRQIGIGDMTVGKHIGRMMSAFGGRIGAYRDAGTDVAAMHAALIRNLWRGADDAPQAGATRIAERLIGFRTALDAQPVAAILAGDLPPLSP